jgi:hypothetical protein
MEPLTPPVLANSFSSMIDDIHRGMRSDQPEDPNRPQVYRCDRPADEKHLAVPSDYDTGTVRTMTAERSNGWNIANAKDAYAAEGGRSITSAFDLYKSSRRFNKSVNETGKENDISETKPKTHNYGELGPKPIPAPRTPSPSMQHMLMGLFGDDAWHADSKGWVSDNEGHPEENRISPCTFANLATGCKPTRQLTVPDIPARASSFRRGGVKTYNDVSKYSFLFVITVNC